MGILSSILGFCGFGIGTSIGIVIGYYMFIYFQPTDVKVGVLLSPFLFFQLCCIFLVLFGLKFLPFKIPCLDIYDCFLLLISG
jgi:hypothetical protein